MAQLVFLTIVQLIVTEAAPTSVEPAPVCVVLMFHRSVCPASAVTAPSSVSAFAPMVSWTTSSAAEATVTDGKLELDRKSTRLNSSHSQISYAVFCLKKKKQRHSDYARQNALR